jgi:hypothetical protein
MPNDKEVKKPDQTSKETTQDAAREVTDRDLEKVAGGSGMETTALTCAYTHCHEQQ